MTVAALKHLRAVDALIIAFTMSLTAGFAALGGPAGSVAPLLAVNVVLAAAILALGAAADSGRSRALGFVRDFYPAPTIFLVYKEVHVVIQSLGRPDLDPAFIAVDRWIFGTDPTAWMARFAHPALTELLQVSYGSYFFIMLALGVEIWLREPRETYAYVLFAVVYGFCLSYVGYIALPGVGPRFTLHDFASLDAELPGLWLTEAIRAGINAAESILPGTPDPMAAAQRDVFPSGHTQLTLLTIFFAWRYRIRSRHVVTVLGALLIVSTVYLRYHYVIDLIGGAAFALLTLLTAPVICRWWERRRS